MAIPFPDIDPVALAIGPVQIRWYALAYVAGFVLGWVYALRMTDKFPGQRPNREDIDDFIPWVIIGVILGGRLGYVLFYQPEYYFSNLMEIFKVWHGGMSFHGGVLGVIAAVILFAWRKGVPVLRLSDMVCCVAPIGLFFGRLANFVNGELYGRETDVSWAVAFPSGGDLPRHPSQLYEAGLEGAVLFLILFVLFRIPALRERSGILTGTFLAFYAAFRSFVEFFREPDEYLGLVYGPFSMGQILCLPMLIAGLALIAYAVFKKDHAASA